MTAGYGFANADTAPLLGSSVSGQEMQKVDLDHRAGIMTDLSMLTATAQYAETSPVRRGVFVREHLLCQELPAPPDNVELLLPEISPDLTTRERFAAHTADESCAGCHQLIDGIGFGFEAYDAIGRYRDTENGKPIDATGEVVNTEEVDGPFDGAVELADKLAQSSEARQCLIANWFRFAQGRSDTEEDLCTIEALDVAFREGASIRQLLVAITQTPAFMFRRPYADETQTCN